jgi:asparagine synthase (glutamine-hydrolysing)
MCGIAGIVGPAAAGLADRVDDMLAALRHRGPDDTGLTTFDNAVLGTSRLSIIDLAHGHQPLLGPDGKTALVCNGEIYGHRRIRDLTRDYPYRTGSDSEVILALHDRHGHHLLPHLPGTFSFALWDDASQSLLLARDRFGERPLYWAEAGDLLVFASEVEALLASGLVRVELDRTTLAHVLRQGYVPPGMSIWRGVTSLRPASRLCWTPSAGWSTTRWWNAPPVGADPGRGPAAEWFRDALDRSVSDQLEADVPIGAFLSGGIDSSTIAVLASRHRPGLDVFAFDMPGSSVVEYARAVAERSDVTLHVCRPEIDRGRLAELIVEMAGVWDEPFADSSALPTWMLSRFAREHVTVALTGDGADELLGGYLCWARGYLEPSDPARGGRGSGEASQAGRLRRWARRTRSDDRSGVARRFATFRRYLDADELAGLGLPALDIAPFEPERYVNGTADDISRYDLDHYLPGDILVKTDRASMAHGLEVRSPFLGVEVAEGCLRLPATRKVDATSEKIVLRDAVADLLPEAVRNRTKQGFGAPMTEWLQDAGVVDLVDAHLRDRSSAFFDLVDHGAVQRHLAAADQATWNLLTVALWWERHRRRTVA